MKALLWDMDDTLLDTIEARMKALGAAYGQLTGEQIDPRELWRGHRGRTLEELARHLFGERDREFIAAYREHYAASSHRAHPYPGVVAALKRCREAGLDLAVVTSRSSWTAADELAAAGLLEHFHAVVAFDDTDEHKPDPEPLLHALRRLAVDDVSAAAFVGDAPADILAARRAGCRSIAAAWGTLDRDLLLHERPDAVAERPEDVPRLVLE